MNLQILLQLYHKNTSDTKNNMIKSLDYHTNGKISQYILQLNR